MAKAKKTKKKAKRKKKLPPVDLARFQAQDVLKAIATRAEDPKKVPKPLATALKKGDAELKKSRKVTAFLPCAKILDNQEWNIFGDLPGEVYVVALAFDLTGEGAELERAGEVFKKVGKTASRPLIVSSSPVFNGIYDGDNLPLLGDGITLYGPKDPNGLLDIHVAIMEDDGGYRELGGIIEEAAQKLEIAEKVGKLAELASMAAPEVFAAKVAVELLFYTVVASLKYNHDDVIQDFHFSALAHQHYLAGRHPFEFHGARGEFEIHVS